MKKRILSIVLCIALLLSFASCTKENDTTPSKSTTKIETSVTKKETSATKKEVTVYVSKSGKKIHRNKKCSGMKYYWEMSYEEAVDAGYDFCDKCY